MNGIKIPNDYLLLQTCCFQNFKLYKIRITPRLVEDITDEEQICEVVEKEHRRAHRNSKEVRIQILEKYYFPRMASIIRTQLSTCTTCKLYKYDRHPNKPPLQPTPIPKLPMWDTSYRRFHIGGKIYLSCIDKFSKFDKLFPLPSKLEIRHRETLLDALHYFTAPRIIVSDNERGLLCPTVLNY